jgi:hypothetical protein
VKWTRAVTFRSLGRVALSPSDLGSPSTLQRLSLPSMSMITGQSRASSSHPGQRYGHGCRGISGRRPEPSPAMIPWVSSGFKLVRRL